MKIKKSNKFNILLIDNNLENYNRIKKLLKFYNYNLEVIFLKEENIKKILKNKYSLIIINLKNDNELLEKFFLNLYEKNLYNITPILLINSSKKEKFYYKNKFNILVIDNISKKEKFELLKLKINNLLERNKKILLYKKDILELQGQILNSLPMNICLISNNGTILFVNETWKSFAKKNNYKDKNLGIGLNYFDICEKAFNDGLLISEMVSTGIQSVLYGKNKNFSIEYLLFENNWYQLIVSEFYYDKNNKGAIIMHLDISIQKNLELEVKNKKQYLETLTKNAPNIIMEINKNYEIIYINRFSEYFRNDILGKNIINFISYEYIHIFKEFIDNISFLKKNTSFIIKLLSIDNREWWANINATTLYLDDDNYSIILILEDITNKKKIEEELKVTTEFLIKAQEIAKLAIIKLNYKKEIIYFSEQIYSIFEIKKDIEISLNILIDKFFDDDKLIFNEIINNLKELEKKYSEFKIVSLNKKKYISIVFFMNSNELILTIQDISENKNYENILEYINKVVSIKVGSDYLKEITDLICKNFEVYSSYICKFNENKTIDVISFSSIDKFNYSIDKLKNINLYETPCRYILEKKDIVFINNINNLFPNSYFISSKKKFNYIGIPIISNLEIIGSLVIINDKEIDSYLINTLNIITARLSVEIERLIFEEKLIEKQKKLQETLNKLENTQKNIIKQERLKALGEMASGIAHDFNNAISPILGYTELLLNNRNLPQEKIYKYLEKIKLSVIDAASVVKTLKEFYREESSKENYQNIVINEIIIDVIKLTKHKWKDQAQKDNKYIIMETDLDEPCNLYANPTEIREILTNIIFNSVDSIKEKGKILIKTINMENYINIQIIDTGSGIEDKNKSRLFEPFFTTKGKNGTGLGLYVTNNIVVRYGGKIEVSSVLGQGTCFSIYLPLISGKETIKKEKLEEKLNKKLHILIVEDKIEIQEVLEEYLMSMNFSYEVANNGFDGLNKFQRNYFDLIITDYAMPEMNGKQMIDIIRKISAKKPIILLTGFGDIIDLKKQKIFGNVYILTKPITINSLKEIINTIISRLTLN